MPASSLSTPMPCRALPCKGPRARGLRARLATVLVAASGACAFGAWPSVARAEPPSDAVRAVQLNEAGSELYAAGNYPAALQAFQQAYALIAEANLLFNIAGCHERMGQRTQAMEYYRWFLSSTSANPEGRRRAIAALSRLEAEPAPKRLPVAPRAEAAPGSNGAGWPLATLGAGILFAGLGAGLYLDGAHDHNEVTSAPGFGDSTGSSTLTEVRARKLIDSGDTKKRVGAVGFGLGGALIATHVAINLWRSGTREDASHAELRLSPSGWAVAGQF